MQLTALLLSATPDPLRVAASPILGWLVAACVFLFLANLVLHADGWRRFWLRTEDPRTLGLFRIVFGLLVFGNLWGLRHHLDFFFSDEGMFLTESARNFFAGHQFAGYGDAASGDPGGFFDAAGVLRFASGPKWSLLFFWDSPLAVSVHAGVLVLLLAAFTVGLWTRATGWLAFLAMLSLMHRNAVFWTGADVVFKVFFFYLVLSRSGHAYSLDNWLRCRRLRARGELSEIDGPGLGAGVAPSPDHPRGLAAIYRRIPAWPRRLMLLQLCLIYLWTGSAKTGALWSRGDSLYYALNLDHFARVPTQLLTYVFGTNVFRLMTWTVHTWQILFSLVFVGMWMRWAKREQRDLPPPSARLSRWRAWAYWSLGAAVAATAAAGTWMHHYRAAALPRLGMSVGLGTTILFVWGATAWLWPRLRDGGWVFHIGPRRREVKLDADFVGGWLLGRRVWLVLGVLFHLHIFALMNIGMFAPVMLGTYLTWLHGSEVARLLAATGRALSRVLPERLASRLQRVCALVPAESPSLPTRARVTSPARPIVLSLALLGAALSVMAFLSTRPTPPVGWWVPTIFGLVPALIWARRDRRRERGLADLHSIEVPRDHWAYGPLGRVVVSVYLFAQVGAIGIWAIPNQDLTSKWRKPSHDLVVPFLRVTNTFQGWNMFAPNPGTANVFLRVLVTDANGDVWDMMTDANSPRLKDTIWLDYSRAGKFTRRIANDKEGKAYRQYYAGYFCRRWQLEHQVELPSSVELVRDFYEIPKPGTREPWEPAQMLQREGKHVSIFTTRCKTQRDAQLPNHIRARHGFEAVDPSTLRTFRRKRHARWTKTHP